LLNKLEEQNRHYKNNLAILYKLRNKKNIYSNILLALNNITGDRCCLTDIEASSEFNASQIDSTACSVNITGLAYNQSSVAALIKKIESLNQFKDVSLIYSSSSERNNSPGVLMN